MRCSVIPRVWDDALQQYVIIPLDDAEPDIITLANLVHGHELTMKQFNSIIMRLGIQRDKIGH